MEYFSAIKWHKVLTQCGQSFKTIKPDKRAWTKATCCIIPFGEKIWKRQVCSDTRGQR
jgi:hypothetical protein